MTSPIKPVMSCSRFNDTLADFLERDVPEATRAEMEAHALGCDDCGPLLADLRKLRLDAANLTELTPSRDLWAGIAARIETPVVSIGTDDARKRRGARRRVGSWIGLAAAGLIAITATATYQITKRSFQNRQALATSTVAASASPATDTTTTAATVAALPEKAGGGAAAAGITSAVPGATRAAALPAAIAPAAPAPAKVTLASNPSGKLSPAETYDREISRLRDVVDHRRNDLDSATVAVLERNLHIIDDAIAQCRKALKLDPSSAYLHESLNEALDNKVQLLRAAATLPSGL
jgi:hypothetical protein